MANGNWRTLARVSIHPRINVWIRVFEPDGVTSGFDPPEEVVCQTGLLAKLARLLRKVIREQGQ